MKKLVSRKEEGFTLIEIISVLSLLGILATTAVPKFLGMQDKAKDKANYAAVAEGGARIMLTSAKLLLANGKVATNDSIIADINAWPGGTDVGVFFLTLTAVGSNTITVKSEGRPGTAVDGSSEQKDFGIPQS